MKQILLSTLFVISLTSLKSQTYMMCQSVNSSTSSTGTLYDSGGPNGNYQNNQNCLFLIQTTCPADIILNFTSFSTELNYDYLAVYDGSTTTSPILGSYWGTGSVPSMTATSGFMLIRFYSDYTATLPGFEAHWTFSNLNCPPVANFNYSVNTCQGKVNLLDATTSTPTSWLWNFGDGNAATMQNPVHTYTAPGTYSITLIASNSFGNSTMTKTVTVNPIQFDIGYMGAPLMNSPMSFTTTNTTGQVYTWNFGDGGTAGFANSIHTFKSLGTFTVSLTIATGSCVTTQTMLVTLSDGVGINQSYIAPYNASIQPNPFVGSSQLHLQLAENSAIKIEVINQMGQLIKVISNDALNAGQHQFELDGIPAGLHYVKITENGHVSTLKLVSLK